MRCSHPIFSLIMAVAFVCLGVDDVIAKTCDEDDAEVRQVSVREFMEKGTSYTELIKSLENQAVEQAFLMVNPTQRSIYERSVISASSNKGVGTTAQREYSGSQFSHKFIKTRYIKPLEEYKPITDNGFNFLVGRIEVSVCKIKKEDIFFRVSIDRIKFNGLPRPQWRTAVLAAFPQTKKISFFKANRGEAIADVVVQGGIDRVLVRWSDFASRTSFDVKVRVQLTAYVKIQHRPLSKVQIKEIKDVLVPRGASQSEIRKIKRITIEDLVEEALEKAATELGKQLVEVLL